MAAPQPGPGRQIALALLGLHCLTAAAPADDRDPDGAPAVQVIRNARVFPGRGVRLDNGVVVIRDGLIEAVGPAEKVAIPFDAEVTEGEGLVVYPGFLDLGANLGVPEGTPRSRTGAGRSPPLADSALARTPPDNRNGLTPEFDVASVFELPEATAESRRKLGFTALLATPGGAIACGQSALVGLGGRARRESILRSPVALHIVLRPPHEAEPARDGPEPNNAPARRRPAAPPAYPMSLMGTVAHLRQAMADAEHHHQLQEYVKLHGGPKLVYDPSLDSLYLARTRGLSAWWEANTRDEIHRALDLAEEFGTDALIVGGREAAKVVDRLKALDVPVVLRLDYSDEPKVPTFEEYRKLAPAARTEPLRAMSRRAAIWKEQVGTAAALARAGVRFAFASEGLGKPELFMARLRSVLAAGLSPDAAVDALTRQAADLAGAGSRLGTIEPGKLAHLTILTAPLEDAAARTRYVFIDGHKFDPDKPSEKRSNELGEKQRDGEGPAVEATPESRARTGRDSRAATRMAMDDQASDEPFVDVATEFDEDRKPRIHTGGNVLIKDAVLLTVSPAGTIPRGSILVRNGKIEAIGPDLAAPEGVMVLEAGGLVAIPGIIDTHSHMAIQGGVNESSLAIVPEVQVRDVVDGSDPSLYRALAGGTTTARLLHGSSDPIGGQDAVIKIRPGEPGRDLLLRDPRRPRGVKFALGENVTRRPGRFPGTRMGVEATLERAFEEARAYRSLQETHRAASARGQSAPPLRRDMRLEALADILNGTIQIHAHAYRADEILMLMELAERQGIHVRSLQHALEGYKVAPEIAAHGASVSTFSDWWAYKVEAFDAIPFNAALLTEAGVRVCIKSDSNELVRHLALEASKTVRHGGVSEADALAMITLNPARELGLEHRLGSLEVGKDADIALFNAHPFDSFARCEAALVDGEVWFQRPGPGAQLTPRPGEHATMPRSAPGAIDKALDLDSIKPGEDLALKGATLHPVAGPPILDGVLVLSGGKIQAIGGPETLVSPGARTLDLSGLDVWPGLIDAGNYVGLYEIGSLPETQDFADTAQFQPELRTSVALHADSALIPVTRANGVLTSYVQPTGGLIAGQGCLVNHAGWVPREMLVADRVALNVRIPAYTPPDPARPMTGDNDPNRQRKNRLEEIKQYFRRAYEYDRIVAEARALHVGPPVQDPRLAALGPHAKGEKPVLFHAERRVEILDALKLARELKLKAVITGGLEAWKVAAELKKAEVPVLIGGTLRLPAGPTDPYDAAYTNPAQLQKAGVKFALRSVAGGPDLATAPRNLPFEAAVAVAFGLTEEEALRSVTLSPAEILGVDQRLGSLGAGKDANLVVTAGPILQVTSSVKAVFIAGRPHAPTSRHTELYLRYLQRLDPSRKVVAPTGLAAPEGHVSRP